MKLSQAFHFLLLVLNFSNCLIKTDASQQLDEFLKAVTDAQSELHWIGDISMENLHRRKRSASIDELLGRFEFDDEAEIREGSLEGGDAWYQSFRAMECSHGGCPKRPLRWKTRAKHPDDEYEYYDYSDEGQKTTDLKDQWEETQNDLSHEADYKLSKIEQEAMEKNLPNTAWPIRHNMKRSINPMDEVKLKTSIRLLQNGDGPTLPSAALEEEKPSINLDDVLSDSKHDESPDPWKESYEVMESRKLLSLNDAADDYVITDEKICGTKNCLNHALDFNQFDNLKEKEQIDRTLEGLSFDNAELANNHQHDKGSNVMSLSDELMHSAAFLKLQNFLKGKPKSVEPTTKPNKTEKVETKTTTLPPSTSNPLGLVEKDRNVNIKLHMSVNATVLGDTKVPDKFHRNNTVTFKPPTTTKAAKVKDTKKKPKSQFDYNFDMERLRRGVVFPIFPSNTKRKANVDISKSVAEATEDFPLDELITGKLTSQLVKAVFALVKSSPSLKVLWPGLMKNQVANAKQVQNFYAIRNHENESEMHRTELMLRQAMETINAIIEQQVRSRSCVPLRADLKAFYNQILATKAENDRLQARQKREVDSKDTPPLSDSQIRKKSRIVKKLLKNYEELPGDEQDQVAKIKESLIVAAEELRELEQMAQRRKREILENQMLSNATILYRRQPLDPPLTPEYVKLARTAEMLLHNSLKDADITPSFNYI